MPEIYDNLIATVSFYPSTEGGQLTEPFLSYFIVMIKDERLEKEKNSFFLMPKMNSNIFQTSTQKIYVSL